MADAILMPKLGQTVEEATIVKWHKKEGDTVEKGDVLFELETDKAVLEAESFYSGVLLKIFVPEDGVAPVTSVVAYVGEPGEKAPDRPALPEAATPAPARAQPEAKKSAPAKQPVPAQQAAPATVAAAPVVPATPAAPTRLFISPRARALAKAKAIDPSAIRGTGPNGRIVVKDVEAHLEAVDYNSIRITPAAKKLAIEEGIDILSAKGTGTGGKIAVADVKARIAEEPVKMSKMRQTIARRLSESFMTIPHFYVTVEADMTELLKYRQQLKAEGVKYTVTDFVLEAVILSLKEFKPLNSSTDGVSVSWRSSVDLGLAVALDEGLVVPVIWRSEDLSMQELHDTAKDLATRAIEGKLMPDEMVGGSFTVSNMGMLDVDQFNAIINPGEAGIIAIASTRQKPVVIDGEVKVRSMMTMTLSVDHRIVDGKTAAEFVNTVKSKLEDIELWKQLA